MLPAKKTPHIEELSEEKKEHIVKSAKSELLCENMEKVFESIDKIYLFDEGTERFYSRLASNLLISLFILDFTRKLNNNINKKYDIEPLDINAVLEDNRFKKYYKNQVKDLDKDKLIAWFINKGIPVLDDCLYRKQYTDIVDVINVDINMELLREYLERVEDDFDFYEILTQFKRAFEKYPSESLTLKRSYTRVTTKNEIIEHDETEIRIHQGRDTNIHNINKGWYNVTK